MKKMFILALSVTFFGCTKTRNTPALGTIRFVNNTQEQFTCYVDDTLSYILPPTATHDFIVKYGEHLFAVDQKTGFPRISEDGYATITNSTPFVVPIN